MSNKIIKFNKNKRKNLKILNIVLGLFMFIVSGIVSCMLLFKLFSLIILNSLSVISLIIGFVGYKKIKKEIKKKNDRKIKMMREQLRVIKNEDICVDLINVNNNKYSYEYNNDNNLRIVYTSNSRVLKRVK